MASLYKVIKIMAITKEKKQAILGQLDDIKKRSASIVFVNFKGLSVEDSNTMRRSLAEVGVEYRVVKKTLLKRSLADTFDGQMPTLEGEIAIAYSEDEIAPAQNIKTFTNQYKDHLAIVGGVFAGTHKDQAEMIEIASIPSMTVLRGMFVNVINSPIQGLVISLNQIAEQKAK